MKRLFTLLLLLACATLSAQEHSVARQWNEVLLASIRTDQARPVVHARNLFHQAAGMYDIWSVMSRSGTPFFMGSVVNDYDFTYTSTSVPTFEDTEAAVSEAISYFNYRLLRQRFANSPGADGVMERTDSLMNLLGYPVEVPEGELPLDTPANIGNEVARRIIAFGASDGANEAMNYDNQQYTPVNDFFEVDNFSVSGVLNPDRWQPLAFDVFVDQSGQVLEGNVPSFLGAEWGKVFPFSLRAEDLSLKFRDGSTDEWWVYHDPGPPPSFFDAYANGQDTSWYHWNFELVVKWSRHLDPNDGTMWDISPASIGNIGTENYPRNWSDYPQFYDEDEGGDVSRGHSLNPATGQPYPANIVPRGDYARVLAEFWADGPDSETPPGHWFVIMNEKVLDHPDFERKFRGQGEALSSLEYDIKAYLILGGAMHDAAITAWGIKGFYDYVRPFTAIRYLANRGQRSVPSGSVAPYDELGINLFPGVIEAFDDPAGVYDGRTFFNIRFNNWRGNRYIEEYGGPIAGVGWMNAGWWEPYQRPTFVTPNFAGYVSGHSTFSSAAAEVLERMTGDPFFPGGVAEFLAPANEFLVFEEGPSVDVRLQWATYRDASDQTSLSRIWGGIHPPVDDIPGRLIGIEVGKDAFALAEDLFSGNPSSTGELDPATRLLPRLFGNPVRRGTPIRFGLNCQPFDRNEVMVYDATGRLRAQTTVIGRSGEIDTDNWPVGIYFMRVQGTEATKVATVQVF